MYVVVCMAKKNESLPYGTPFTKVCAHVVRYALQSITITTYVPIPRGYRRIY